MHRLGILMAAVGVALLAAALAIFRNAQPTSLAPIAPVASAPPRSSGPPAPATPAVPPVPPTTTPEGPARRRPEPSTRATAAVPAAETPAPAPAAGALTITSDVSGAQVFLDRQFIGTAPVTAAAVAPGSHQLNVSAPGYDPIVQTIDVAAGSREIAVRFREVRLNLTLDVIHKHRLGSCRGRLVATPQGLRYETTDKDDAFSAGLLEFDTFQVDYLAKTLRLQPRRGRRFDFTDPDGNADRLFVFHRDVDKAREQLRKGDVDQDPVP